ncbi:phage tail tape measure protein [Rhodoplanes serenus]|nr:phage tail tape measure protein [Rhodoplanes serenus]
MAISVLVRLVDRLTGPIERVMGRVRALGALGGRIGDLTRRLEEAAGKAGRLASRIGAIGAIGAGLTFAAPVQAAAQFDDIIRDIGITADLSGSKLEAMIGSVGPALEKLALEVGQPSLKLAEGLQVLGASGLELPTAQGMMRTIGRVATAAGAEVTEVARSAFALHNNLKISVDEMELALAKLVTAGKLGRFEFKNMARELPELTAGIQRFGLSGMEAVSTLGAALQVVMFGTSDPSVAANNLSELFGKFFTKETIKNFKDEFDVSITGVIQNARARGLNPFESAMEKLLKVTGISAAEVRKIYDEASAGGANQVEAFEAVREHIEAIGAAEKIQRIFGDKQALNAIIPFATNLDKYKQFKAAIASADTAIIARDLAGRLAGLTKKLDHLAEIGQQAMRRVGTAFATHVPFIFRGIVALQTKLAEIEAKNPGMVDQWLAWGGAVLLVVAALGILGPAVWAVSQTVGLLWAVLRGGVLVVAVLSRAVVALGAALMTTPVGWVIAGITAIALAAYLIWQHWEPIKAFFAGLWTGITTEADRVWTGLTTGVQTAARLIGGVFSAMWTDVEQTFRAVGDRISAWWDGLIPDWARGLFGGGTTVPGAAAATGAARAGASPAGPGPQKQEVGGKIVVKIDGPGRVESVTSDSRAVPIEADRGPMLAVP